MRLQTQADTTNITMGGSRGDELFSKAEKKASSSTGWFGSNSSKWEDAADLFQQVSAPGHLHIPPQAVADEQAGNAYKVDGQWDQSGKAFEK